MVVLISREYGSGGRVIGKKVAEKLGFKFYDKEMISFYTDKNIITVNKYESQIRNIEKYFCILCILVSVIGCYIQWNIKRKGET